MMGLAVPVMLLKPPASRLAAAVAGVGLLSGTMALDADGWSCASRLPAARVSLALRVAEPVAGGGVGAGRPVDAGCSGLIDIRWAPRDSARAGDLVRVRGRWLPRPGALPAAGILLAEATQRIAAQPSAVERLRTATARDIARLYGPRAPVVGALVLNSRGAMDPDLRDQFAQSGLVHILSISGFHVGLLAAWVVLVARGLGASRSRALALGAALGTVYVAFLGWPAPATRAAALAALLALAYRRQRRIEPNALLAASCLVVMLVDPWAVLNLGGWLSAAALWGASTFTRWSDRAHGEGFWSRTLFSTVGATLATAPLTAAALGAVAPIGIALNFIAIPVAAVGVPGVLASLLAAPLWPGLAAALAAGAGLALHGLELLARLGSAVPGGHAVGEASLANGVPWALALLATLWALGRRNTRTEAIRRGALLLAMTAWGLLLFRDLPATDAAPGLTLDFLDVGQGDGAVLRTPAGHWILIDAGPLLGSADAGRRVVAPFLARHGVRRLSAIVISHAHADHVGGAASVLRRFRTDAVLEPGDLYDDPAYAGFLDAVAEAGVPWRTGRAGATFALDGVRFTLLHPDTTWAEWHDDLNEDSIVLRVDYGGFSALFAGDAGLRAEARMAGHVGRVDLLKVGHHGSRSASGDGWLAELSPRAAIVSVGARNRYGHPSAEALGRLARHGVDIWRTDRDGGISAVTDGQTLTLRARGRVVRYPVE
jgi:competence protein ComEC